MSRESVLDDIKKIMADVFDVDDAAITPDTTAADVEEWDSLSHIRLIVSVERRFKVKFTNPEIEKLARVGDLVALVEAKQPA